jgi:hypothetical protein
MSGYLMERETDRAWVGPSPIRNLRCVALARGAKSSSLPTVTAAAAELQFADGRLATLEFEGQGGARMTARDTSGRQVFTGRTFELAAVREWLAASTPRDAGDALDDLDAWAMVVYWEIADLVLPSGRSTPESALFPGGRVGTTSVFSTSTFGSSGSGSASTRQEPWPAGLLRCAVVLWPATWLAGLAAVLPAVRRPPAERGANA